MCLHLVYTGHVKRATLQKLREKDGLQLKYWRDLSNLNSAINILYTLQQFTFAPSAKQERDLLSSTQYAYGYLYTTSHKGVYLSLLLL